MQEIKTESQNESRINPNLPLIDQKKALEHELEDLKKMYYAHRLSNREYYRQFEAISLHLIDIQRTLHHYQFKSN